MANSKKYAIVSWIGVANYGTNLQAVALYKACSNIVNNCEVVNILFDAKKINSFKNSLFLIKQKAFNLWRKYPLCPSVRYKNVHRFIENECQCKVIDEHSELKKIDDKYDRYIVGSDQVWNPNYINNSYNLSFTNNRQKFSYASSIGVSQIDEDKREYYDKLNQFNKISVREESARQILSIYLKKDDIKTVVDPTLLLDKAEWKRMSENANIPQCILGLDKILLLYFVEPKDNYVESINKIKEKHPNHSIVILNANTDEKSIIDGITMKEAGPYEFLWLIDHADVVCTDSFHAITISLLFQKEFWVIKRFNDNNKESQNSRISDLFESLSISRFCDDIKKETSDLDYEEIHRKLDKMRKNSVDYLKNILCDE